MSAYYTMADIERIGPAGCLKHMNELHETNKQLVDRVEHYDVIEQLARDLLARLSQDYGDSEYNDDHEIDILFERGERWLPIDDTQGASPLFTCEECGKSTPVRMNGSCVECATRQ